MSNLTSVFIDRTNVRLLDFLIDNQLFGYSISDLVKHTGMEHERVVRSLEKLSIVELVSMKENKFKFNAASLAGKSLFALDMAFNFHRDSKNLAKRGAALEERIKELKNKLQPK